MTSNTRTRLDGLNPLQVPRPNLRRSIGGCGARTPGLAPSPKHQSGRDLWESWRWPIVGRVITSTTSKRTPWESRGRWLRSLRFNLSSPRRIQPRTWCRLDQDNDLTKLSRLCHSETLDLGGRSWCCRLQPGHQEALIGLDSRRGLLSGTDSPPGTDGASRSHQNRWSSEYHWRPTRTLQSLKILKLLRIPRLGA